VTKQLFLSILKRVGIYHRLRTSFVYQIYLRYANKQLLESRDQEVSFYRDLLKGFDRDDLIFDIGANVGEKTDAFLRIGARVVAVEPDEQCQAILREKFLQHRFVAKRVTIVGKAASESDGIETMWVDGPGSALNTLNRKWADALKRDKVRMASTLDALDFAETRVVKTTSLEKLIDTYGLPFFVKIDVEGLELKVLQGLRRSVPYLSFEVNLPEFKREGMQCVELLGGLARRGQFNYTRDCRSGLALKEWLDDEAFTKILDRCDEKCIEVFWRTPR
jgi:FkbM family methyltransferase